MTTFTRFDIKQDPFELAKKGRVICGEISSKSLPRLKDILVGDALFQAQMDFGISDTGQRVVTGDVKGDVELLCQRCLESFTQHIKFSFKLGIVSSEQEIARLTEDCEPLLVEGDEILLSDIIEDELILALPPAPTHKEGECSASSYAQSNESMEDVADETRQRPFEGLADLLKKNSD